MSTESRESLDDRVARLSADRRALVAELLRARATAPGEQPSAICPRDRSRAAPLSYAQQRLWFLHHLAGAEPFYNIDYARRFNFPLDFGVLERAINEIVRRHESLRTTFAMGDGEPLQVVAPELRVPLLRIDLSSQAPMVKASEAARIAIEEARRSFDLTRGPILRTTLVTLSDTDAMLLLTMHHIVCDAWSMMVFARELIALYRAFVHRQDSPLPELPIQYADYAVWQRDWLRGPVLERELAYWTQRLAALPTLMLPADRVRPALPSFRGTSWYVTMPAELLDTARQFSQQQGVTLFMTLLTAFVALLHHYSGQDDIVVGAPVANRNQPETQHLIGCFVNTIVLRVDASGTPTVRELIDRVRATVSDGFAHQDVPFEMLVEHLQPQRDLSRNPLYQVSLQVYQHATADVVDPKLIRQRVHVDKGTATIDLAFDFFVVAEGLIARIEYSTDLFDPTTIERMLGHFQTLLRNLPAHLDAAVADLPLMTPAETQQVIADWNRTEFEYPREARAHELVEAQAARTPDATAIVSAAGSVTYRELDERATGFAARLQALGVGPNVLVGVCLPRSPDIVAALLGVWKAGGAYIPLDPAYPRDRLAWLIKDGQPAVVVADRHMLDRLPTASVPILLIDDESQVDGRRPGSQTTTPASHDLAYVIYTSGSTGRPNGVLVEHRAVVMQLSWMQLEFPLTCDDRVVQKYSIAFDASVLEMFWPLTAGARLVLADRDQQADPSRVLRAIMDHEVTVVDLVPSLLEAFADDERLPRCTALRRIICGGEAIPLDLPRKVLEQTRAELINMYGPTEATINATYWRYDASASSPLPIGRPVGNTKIYILDRRGHPAPIGVPGEIHIGGEGVARGYLNRPELTAARFVRDPFASEPASRMFRSGDLGRFLPSGDIEFLGRVDDQVKVSGFRVETAEVQAAVSSHPAVRSAFVTARPAASEQKRLVAYVVPRAGEPEIWPSIGEYFAYDELTYHAMTHDDARNRAYRAAIASAVKGKTVLDLGTGADALWARYAAAEGAKHVYAIEGLEAAYHQAARLLAKLGLESRITLLQGDSMQLALPEPVDVCVSELIGTIGSSEGVVPILNDARRFLKPTGVMIPFRCTTRIAAVSLPQPLRDAPAFSELTRGYVDRIFQAAGGEFDVRVCLKNLPENATVSDAADFEVLDFTAPQPPSQNRPIAITVVADGALDGFVLWVCLQPSADQLIDVIRGEHSWLPVFFPVFSPPLAVRAGDRIEGSAHVLENGTRTPDYRVHGHVRHGSGAVTPFDYTSYHQPRDLRHSPFHAALLAAAPTPVVRAGTSPSERRAFVSQVREHVRQRLPDYMVPRQFVVMNALPLTPAGKVSPQALPEPDVEKGLHAAEFVNPRTEIEWTIARVWRDLLGVRNVGAHDNFFDLGGHSLLILRLQSRLREQLGAEVSLTDLFQFPTVATLASQVARVQPADASEREVISPAAGHPGV